jgi:hypothetical protein
VELEKQPSLGNGCVTCNNGVQPVPRLYNKDFDFDDYKRILIWQLKEYEFGVRWPPAGKGMSSGAEDSLLLKDVTKQSSEDHDWKH